MYVVLELELLTQCKAMDIIYLQIVSFDWARSPRQREGQSSFKKVVAKFFLYSFDLPIQNLHLILQHHTSDSLYIGFFKNIYMCFFAILQFVLKYMPTAEIFLHKSIFQDPI
jgi:hypothetical protein